MLRFVLASLLVILVTFIGSNQAIAAPKTYSSAQIEQIQSYVPSLEAMRSRLVELDSLISNQKWVDVQSLIHGPLGELRPKIAYLSRKLLPKDAVKSKELSQSIFEHLVSIDNAAQVSAKKEARSQYKEALKDIDSLLALLPKS